MKNDEKKGASDSDLTVTIKTPLGDWENVTFPKTAKVQDVINATIAKFQFAQTGNYKLFLEPDTSYALQPERTLVSYHVKDGDVFLFADLGIAV